MFRWCRYLFLFIGIVSASVWSAPEENNTAAPSVPAPSPPALASKPARDWRQNVSYGDFERLIHQKVLNIPDLVPLWSSRRGWTRTADQDVYFGGGRLRGLIRWTEEQLEKNSYDEVLKLPAPALDSLGVIDSTDKDLWTQGIRKSWIQEQSFGKNWDVLDEYFYKASLASGGADIEKFRVGLDGVDDPRGALKAYYERQSHYTDPKFGAFYRYRANDGKGGIRLNSKLALILRYLRFSKDLPAAKISDEE